MPTPPKVLFVCFTFTGDQPLLPGLIKSIKDVGQELLLIWDKVEGDSLGARAEVSTFERHGNLNGLECVTAMLGLLMDRGKDYDWVVKIDSDTRPYPKFIKALSLVPAQCRCAAMPGGTFEAEDGDRLPWYAGPCYAFRPSAAKELAALDLTLTDKYHKGRRPEDVVILGGYVLAGHRIHTLCQFYTTSSLHRNGMICSQPLRTDMPTKLRQLAACGF